MPKALESGEIKIKSSWVYVGVSDGCTTLNVNILLTTLNWKTALQ